MSLLDITLKSLRKGDIDVDGHGEHPSPLSTLRGLAAMHPGKLMVADIWHVRAKTSGCIYPA